MQSPQKAGAVICARSLRSFVLIGLVGVYLASWLAGFFSPGHAGKAFAAGNETGAESTADVQGETTPRPINSASVPIHGGLGTAPAGAPLIPVEIAERLGAAAVPQPPVQPPAPQEPASQAPAPETRIVVDSPPVQAEPLVVAPAVPASPASRPVLGTLPSHFHERRQQASTRTVPSEPSASSGFGSSGPANGPDGELERLLISRLSPAMNAFVIAVLRLLGDRPVDAAASMAPDTPYLTPTIDSGKKQLREQMSEFYLMIQLIHRLYGVKNRPVFSPEGPGERIDNETEFFALTEPVTPSTSTAREAIRILLEHARKAQKHPENYPPVPTIEINEENVSDLEVADTLALLLRERQNHAQQMVVATTVDLSANLPDRAQIVPRILNRFLSAVLTALMNPKDGAKVSELMADLLEAEDEPLPEAQTVPGEVPKTRRAAAAQKLRTTADLLRAFDRIGADDEWVLRLVDRILAIRDVNDRMTFVKALRDGLNGVVQEICLTLGELQNTPELAFMRSNRELTFLLEILKKYPDILPPWALQDIVRSIFLLPMNANPFYFVKLVLAHSGPILKSFVQRMAEDQDLRRGSSVFYEICKALQTANLPMTAAEVWQIIQSDPRKYNFISLDPKPLGVGKLAQVHRAMLADGRWVAVRVPKPSAIDLLEPESVGIARDLIRLLAEQFFPDDSPEHAKAKMERELFRLVSLLREETNVEATIENIRLAGHTYNVNYANVVTPGGGSIDIEFRVPEFIPALNEDTLTADDKAKARVIVTEFVDQVGLEDLRKEGYNHSLQAAGLQLYYTFYNRSFTALAKGDIEGGKALIHVDPHLGNLMFTHPVNDPASGRKRLRVYVTDVGLGLRVDQKAARAMLMFNAGASIRHPEMTAAGLWEMRDTTQNSFITSEADLLKIIRKQQSEMWATGTRAQPSAYVIDLWTDGFMNFPNGLLGMTLATNHLKRTVDALGVPPELLDEVEKRLIAEGTPLVNSMVLERWPAVSTQAHRNIPILLSARSKGKAEAARVCQLGVLELANYDPKAHGKNRK